jgi:DNA-binding transcriptional ArsR family regulator
MAAKAKKQARKRSKKGRELTLDERIAKALNHPTRTQILANLQERALAPVELEDIMGETLSNIAYHCRQLLKYGCIEVAEKKQIRGAMRTRYRAITRMLLDRDNWDRLSKETRSGISLSAVGEVVDRASTAIEADTFDKRTDRAVITMKMDADEQAWQEINGIVRGTYESLAEVEARTANRKGPKFRVTVSLLSYESPEEQGRPEAKSSY